MRIANRMLCVPIIVSAMCLAGASSGNCAEYSFNRYPLVHKPYSELPLGAVKPKGWLEDQLRRMADGLTGHLDEYYSLMGERNGWLGGDGDMWERGPYWIDGLMPLAYILDDENLKGKCQKWVESVLASQCENGFFGPAKDLPPEPGLQRNNSKDWWPRMVVLKFMKQYFDATGDERVLTFFDKYFRYQLDELPKTPLGHWTFWGAERGGDNLYIVYWLYNKTGEEYLLKLGDIIASQTADWKGRLTDGRTLSQIYSLHCVNLAQGFKEPVIRYQATGDKSYLDAIDKGREDLMRFLGMPNGMYGADEMLHSADPTQGSEFCSAVELMFSLEKMVEITGRTDWADWLERIAFNALPTQADDDFMSKQYYQQVNQANISRHVHNFITDHDGTDICYGILTGYPCCTSNMHQGWPKFTRNLWLASDDKGLAAMCYSPCEVMATVADGQRVRIVEGGGYPFSETISFDLSIPDRKTKSMVFPLHLRIPGWCKEATVTVNGKKEGAYSQGTTAVVCRSWKDGDHIELNVPMKVSVSRWHEASAVVERGPLVYSLRIDERWEKVDVPQKEKVNYGDFYWQVHPGSAWNYGLPSTALRVPEESFRVVERDTSGYPWNLENTPLEIHAKGVRIPTWTLYNEMAGPIPVSGQLPNEAGGEEKIVLVPYGCTTLRITEFPIILK